MFKKLNILRLFFEEPTKEFSVRETARFLGIAPATASKDLKSLAEKRFLKERKERILKLYKADLESALYRDSKLFYNIRKLRETGFIGALNSFYLKPAIVMFGSCASGTDTETSDFDLLLVSEKTDEFPYTRKFEKKLNRSIHIFVVRTIKDLKNKHLINNIVNGITIQGNVRWI